VMLDNLMRVFVRLALWFAGCPPSDAVAAPTPDDRAHRIAAQLPCC
jgi:hypothetical protein